MVQIKGSQKQKRHLAIATITAGAVLSVSRPAILSRVYAANEYEWVRQEELDPLGGIYTSAASSGNGDHLILGTMYGGENNDLTSPLFISNNYGATWQNVADEIDPDIRYFWTDVDVSNSGQVMVAVADEGLNFVEDAWVDGGVFISEDSGATWTNIAPEGVEDFENVVVSGDGSRIIAEDDDTDDLYITDNLGDSWGSALEPTVGEDELWSLKSLSVSDDGETILVGGENGEDPYTKLFISEDGGDTWTNISPNQEEEIHTVSHDISADGEKIVATTVGFNGGENDAVFVSDDAGANWQSVSPDTENHNDWEGAAISDDGTTLAAVDESEGVFVSNDFGETWNLDDPAEAYEGDTYWHTTDFNEEGTRAVAASENYVYVSGDGLDEISSSVQFYNSEDGKLVGIETPDGTIITCYSGVKESEQATTDGGYQYPLGLVDFCFDTEDGSNEVTLSFVTDLDPEEVVVRKYNPDTKEYSNVPGATVSETVFGGERALAITYTIEDNGPLDLDPDEGEIADPVGLGVLPSELVDTGTPVATYITVGLAIVIVTATAAKVSRKDY